LISCRQVPTNGWIPFFEIRVSCFIAASLQIGRHVVFADEHGTPAQRLYNVLCLAYGSDKKLFGDIVEKGFLPKERAEICADECKQVDLAYRMLIAPHMDAGE
jgi:Putative metallopeptidase